MTDPSTTTTTTPPAFVSVAIATGVAFVLGGFLTARSSPVHWSLAIAGAMLIVLGAFALHIITRANRYARRIDELEAEAAPSSIVGDSDRTINTPDLGLPHGQDRKIEAELEPAPILKPSFTSAVDFRPERPTASIRLG